MITFFNEIANLIEIFIGYALGIIRLMLAIPKGIILCFEWFANIFDYLPESIIMFAMFVVVLGLVFQVLNKGS